MYVLSYVTVCDCQAGLIKAIIIIIINLLRQFLTNVVSGFFCADRHTDRQTDAAKQCLLASVCHFTVIRSKSKVVTLCKGSQSPYTGEFT